MDLPEILLEIKGDIFIASGIFHFGSEEIPWNIYSEAETDTSARTTIKIAKEKVADITIHANSKEVLVEEVQAVSAALVWSGLRSKALQKLPKGCKCEAETWAWIDEIPKICNSFMPSEEDSELCSICDHDKKCHASVF